MHAGGRTADGRVFARTRDTRISNLDFLEIMENVSSNSPESSLESANVSDQLFLDKPGQKTMELMDLPDDCLFQILRHVSHADLARLALTCRAIYEIVSSPSVWIDAINLRFGRQFCLVKQTQSDVDVDEDGWETDETVSRVEALAKDIDDLHKSCFKHLSRLFVPGEVFFITHLDPRPFQRGYWYFVDAGLQSKSLQYAVEWASLKKSAGYSLHHTFQADVVGRVPLRGFAPVLESVCWLEARGFHLSVPSGTYKIVWSLAFAPHTGSLQGTRFEARVILPDEMIEQKTRRAYESEQDEKDAWSVFGSGREGLRSKHWLRWPNRMESRTLWPNDAPQSTLQDLELLQRRQDAKQSGLVSSMVLELQDYAHLKTPRGSWPEFGTQDRIRVHGLQQSSQVFPKADAVHWCSLEQPSLLRIPPGPNAAVEFEVLNLSGLWKHGLILDGVSLIPQHNSDVALVESGLPRDVADLTREDRVPNMGGFFAGVASRIRQLF